MFICCVYWGSLLFNGVPFKLVMASDLDTLIDFGFPDYKA